MSCCSPRSWTFYLFLVCVGDARGLSYYSDAAATRRLGWQSDQLPQTRRELIEADLIAYRRPFYQILDLGRPAPEGPSIRSAECLSVGQLLRRVVEQTQGENDHD